MDPCLCSMCFGGSCKTGLCQVFSHHDACPLSYLSIHWYFGVCLCVLDGLFGFGVLGKSLITSFSFMVCLP